MDISNGVVLVSMIYAFSSCSVSTNQQDVVHISIVNNVRVLVSVLTKVVVH
jgi:hypothetical protein